MSLKLKGKYYYVVFRDLRGKVNSRSLKTTNYNEAKKMHDNFMSNLKLVRQKAVLLKNFPLLQQLNSTPLTEQLIPKKRLQLKNVISIVEKKKKISPTALKYWKLFLKKIEYKYADEITPKIALNYLEKNYGKGNGKSYNNVKAALNGIFKYCLIEAEISQSPFANIANRLVDNVAHHRNLSDEEIDKVMLELDEDLQVITILSRWTTQRLETCARMTPEMFDFERKVFIIDPGKLKRFNKFVCVPILPKLEKFIKPILRKCKDKDVPIVQQIGKGRSNEALSKAFLTALKRCQIVDTEQGKASFHSLRGSAISYFKGMGVPSDVLRKMTGHTTDRMEATYDRSSAEISRLALQWDSVSQNVNQRVNSNSKN